MRRSPKRMRCSITPSRWLPRAWIAPSARSSIGRCCDHGSSSPRFRGKRARSTWQCRWMTSRSRHTCRAWRNRSTSPRRTQPSTSNRPPNRSSSSSPARWARRSTSRPRLDAISKTLLSLAANPTGAGQSAPDGSVAITLPTKLLQPKVDSTRIENLGIEELVTQGTTYFAGWRQNARRTSSTPRRSSRAWWSRRVSSSPSTKLWAM